MPGIKTYHSNAYSSDYYWHLGGWVTPTSAAILDACSGEDWGNIRLAQGGLNSGVRASAKTHYGLDVWDIAIDGRRKGKVWTLSAKLFRSGVIPFPRGFTNDSFQKMKHIHCVRYLPDHAHPQAQAQVREQRLGGDGLVGGRSYTGPNTSPEPWDNSPYNPANIKAGQQTFTVSTVTLLGLSIDRRVKYTRKAGFTVIADRLVHRWGRWNAVTKWGTYYAVSDGSQIYLTVQTPLGAHK